MTNICSVPDKFGAKKIKFGAKIGGYYLLKVGKCLKLDIEPRSSKLSERSHSFHQYGHKNILGKSAEFL